MKNLFIIFATIFISFLIRAKANDGAFYANGNQLIPIDERDISLKKEILSIKRISNDFVQVNVYYELDNPKDEKSILVGF